MHVIVNQMQIISNLQIIDNYMQINVTVLRPIIVCTTSYDDYVQNSSISFQEVVKLFCYFQKPSAQLRPKSISMPKFWIQCAL